jgi:hypothetical protein
VIQRGVMRTKVLLMGNVVLVDILQLLESCGGSDRRVQEDITCSHVQGMDPAESTPDAKHWSIIIHSLQKENEICLSLLPASSPFFTFTTFEGINVSSPFNRFLPVTCLAALQTARNLSPKGTSMASAFRTRTT